MAHHQRPVGTLLSSTKPWLAGSITGAAGSLMLAGLATLASSPLTGLYADCAHANPSTGSGNLPGAACTSVVIALVAAFALRFGPAAYPLIFLPTSIDPFPLAAALSALIAALLAGICCAILPLRKGLVAALVLYLVGLVPYACFAAVMIDTG